MKRNTWFLCACILTWALGCEDLFVGYHHGSCGDDEDLKISQNFYEGAICVDGQAQCPDGRPFCSSIHELDGREGIINSCTGPCIECPDFKGACVYRDQSTQKLSYGCADSALDCWDWFYSYVPLESLSKGCPTQAPDCR